MRPSILDLRAIGATVDVIVASRRPAAIVLNSCPPGRGDREATVTAEARSGLAGYGLPVSPVSVTQRAALSHALINGRAVTEFGPDGKASGGLRLIWNHIAKKTYGQQMRHPRGLAAKKPAAVTPPTKASTAAPAAEVMARAPASPAKDDRKAQTLRLPVAASRQLKLIAIDEVVPAHTILVEAINDAFKKRGKPPIA